MEGHPVQILHITDTGVELDVPAIQKILYDENVRDKMVSVLSVAGAFRQGKSFILNFMLRYLQNQGSCDWMGDPNEPLTGFDWKGGYKRNTTGVLMWSKAFVVKTADGGEVAVILMDTQGTFDCESTMRECATVFALSSMISSVQVYNLSQRIQESDLQNLQIFIEYGRLAYETDDCDAPFQKLLFLVRDWQWNDQISYGMVGGYEYLQDILEISDKQKPELKNVRQHITQCIKTVACFLMPHPGKTVATQATYKGSVSDIEAEFKQQLSPLMNAILSPGNLIVKEIDGKKITAGQLLEYFKAYTVLLQSENLPSPMTIYETTAHANNQIAISEAKKHYATNMERICFSDQQSLSSEQLCEENSEQKQSAVDLFRKTKKMGPKEFCAKYEQMLITQLDDMFQSYLRSTELIKETEDIKTRMKEEEIAFQKQQEELEQLIKDNDMKEEQRNAIIAEMKRKHEEEQDELQNNVKKCQQQMEEMAKNMEQRKNEQISQLVAQNEKERNEIFQKMMDMQAKSEKHMAEMISKMRRPTGCNVM